MKPDSEDKVLIDVLGMEYQALRGDIVHRSSARFAMLPVAAGVFALFAALAQLGNDIPDWGLWSVLAVYMFMTIAAWWDAGRSIGRLSNRQVEIEREINRLMKSKEPILKWETCEQERRGPIGRLTIGRPLPQHDRRLSVQRPTAP